MYRTARLVPCTTLQKTCEGAREASKQARKKLFFDLFYRTSLKTIGHMREREKKKKKLLRRNEKLFRHICMCTCSAAERTLSPCVFKICRI